MTRSTFQAVRAWAPLCVVTALCLCGCARRANRHVVRLRPAPACLSAERIQAMAKPDAGETTSTATLGVTRSAKVSALSLSSGKLAEHASKSADRVFVVISGSGIAILDGVRSPVAAGHVLVVPRKTTFELRSSVENPVVLVCVESGPG